MVGLSGPAYQPETIEVSPLYQLNQKKGKHLIFGNSTSQFSDANERWAYGWNINVGQRKK